MTVPKFLHVQAHLAEIDWTGHLALFYHLTGVPGVYPNAGILPIFVSAGLRGIHFRRFVGAPDRAAASSEHTHAPAAAYEQAVLNSSLFPAT